MKFKNFNYDLKIQGGVDTLDHLVENYTCRRATNRWTLNLFMYLLDVTAYNSFVLKKLKDCNNKNNNKNTSRRISLEKLSVYLIKNLIEFRLKIIQDLNYKHYKTSLIEVITTTLDIKPKEVVSESETSIKTRGKCSCCRDDLNIDKNKKKNNHSNKCDSCNNHVCSTHLTKIILCNKCK